MLKWFFNAGALLLVAELLPNFVIEDFYTALIVALILGILNTVVKPILMILAFPINVITLGLFTWVVNAALIFFVSSFVEGFQVDFRTAAVASVILAIISWFLHFLFQD